MIKYLKLIAILATMSFILIAYSNDKSKIKSNSENSSIEEKQNNSDEDDNQASEPDDTTAESEGNKTDSNKFNDKPSNNNSSNNQPEEKKGQYIICLFIEYARVWLQLIKKGDIEELRVQHIAAGEPANPQGENSVQYLKDIISLSGKTMADGAITYSGNEDGTINYMIFLPISRVQNK